MLIRCWQKLCLKFNIYNLTFVLLGTIEILAYLYFCEPSSHSTLKSHIMYSPRMNWCVANKTIGLFCCHAIIDTVKCTHNISTWAPWYAARSTQLCMLCDVCMHLLSFIHINNKQTTKINRRIWSDAHYGRVAAHALRRGVQNSHPHAPKHARTHAR